MDIGQGLTGLSVGSPEISDHPREATSSLQAVLVAALAALVAACGGGSSDGAGGDDGGRFTPLAGVFNGRYDGSVVDRTSGAILVVDAGTVSLEVAADGQATVTFDGALSAAGRIDGDGRLNIAVDVAAFIQNGGCNTGTITVMFNFGIDGGNTASGPLSSRGLVCQGVEVQLTGVVNASRA